MDLAQLHTKIAEITAAMTANVAKQEEERKQFGAASEETIKAMDEQRKRLDDLEKRINRPDFATGGDSKAVKNLGKAFTASKQYLDVREKRSRFSEPFEFKQDAVTTAESGALATPYHDPDVAIGRPRVLTLKDYVNQVNVTGPVSYFKQSARYVLYTELSAQASSGQPNATVKRSRGIKLGSTVTIGSGVSAENKVVQSINHTTKVVTFTTNFVGTHAVDTQLTSDNFDYSPEATVRPAGKLVFTQENCMLKTIGRHIPVTEEMIEDAPQIENLINVDLTRAVKEEVETQMFHGDGTGEQLTGIFSNTSVLTYLQSNGMAGDTKLDAIRRAMTMLVRRGYRPSCVFISPEDKEEIDLLKGDDGHYINIQMVLGNGISQVMQVPMQQTAALAAGEAAIGDWQFAATIYTRREITVRIVEPDDYSLRGLRAVMANERHGFAIRREDAIVKVSFDAVPS